MACSTITIRKTVFPSMSIVQLAFLIAILESMAGITSGTTGIIVKRRVASRTFGVQGPVSLPHLRVARVGEGHITGDTIPIRPAANRIMEIVHGIPRATTHVMTGGIAASVHVA